MTAVVPAAMGDAVVRPMVVMVTSDVGVEVQLAGKKRQNRIVRVSGDTAPKNDARSLQRILCTAADPSADHQIYAVSLQKGRDCAVPAALCADDRRAEDSTVFHLIKLELLGVSEMLEDFSVIVGYRNTHNC